MRSQALVWAIRGVGLAAGAVLVAAILYIALRASNVLLLVFIAILLGSALEPFINWFRIRTPLGRGATILLVYAAFLGGVGLLLFFLVPSAIHQADELSRSLPPLLQDIRTWAAGLQPPAVSAALVALVDAASEYFKPAPPPAPGQVVAAGIVVAAFVVDIVTILTVVFFWLVEHARLQRWLLSFVPAAHRAGWREAWNEVETRLGLWVRGQLTLMATIGVMTGVAYTVLGLPSALLLGVFAGLAEAIPIVGPAIGAVPAVLIAATVSPELALVVFVVYVVLQFLEGNVLVPIVMKNTIGLSPFIVVVSLLVGAAAGGIVGAFLAVPIAAAIEVVLDRFQARDVPVSHDRTSSGTEDVALDEREDAVHDAAVSALQP